MPRAIRPAWISVHVDGRGPVFESGPRRRDGGLNLSIAVREEGAIRYNALSVAAFGSEDQRTVIVKVYDEDGVEIYERIYHQ